MVVDNSSPVGSHRSSRNIYSILRVDEETMNYNMYRMYVASKKTIARADAEPEALSEVEKYLIADMRLSQTILEEEVPEYAARYKMEQTMWETFTMEQKDFICAQIGWWYLMWKDNMWVEDKPNQHWLGRGKEDLKTMICGE